MAPQARALSVASLIGWRQARDTGKSLPPAESAELEALARGAQLQLGHFGKKSGQVGHGSNEGNTGAAEPCATNLDVSPIGLVVNGLHCAASHTHTRLLSGATLTCQLLNHAQLGHFFAKVAKLQLRTPGECLEFRRLSRWQRFACVTGLAPTYQAGH